jgi:hypothetical protein
MPFPLCCLSKNDVAAATGRQSGSDGNGHRDTEIDMADREIFRQVRGMAEEAEFGWNDPQQMMSWAWSTKSNCVGSYNQTKCG